MATWVIICIWVVWTLCFLYIAATFHQFNKHNNDYWSVRLEGIATFKTSFVKFVLLFIAASIFWIGYNISLIF
jgi:heme/copper-type cytochrome/quinol oxidase subunit 2